MKLQTKKRVWSAVLVAALAVANFQAVDASTMSKAKDAKKQAEQELNEANRQIEEIEQQKSQLQGEIDEKDAELVNLLVNIGILEDELKDKNVQLEQVKELINRIADYYDLPDDEEVEEMRRLTGGGTDRRKTVCLYEEADSVYV